MKYILIFILGATISSSIVWHLMTTSGERVAELLMVISDSAALDFYSALQRADDAEVKCFLAKRAGSIAASLNEKEAAESPLLGPPGLGPFSAKSIVQAREKYISSGAASLASNCTTQTKLFK